MNDTPNTPPNIPPNVADAIAALRAIVDALALEIEYMTGNENETLGNWHEMIDAPPDDIRELTDDIARNIGEIESLGLAMRNVARDAMRKARPHIDEIEIFLDADADAQGSN